MEGPGAPRLETRALGEEGAPCRGESGGAERVESMSENALGPLWSLAAHLWRSQAHRRRPARPAQAQERAVQEKFKILCQTFSISGETQEPQVEVRK